MKQTSAFGFFQPALAIFIVQSAVLAADPLEAGFEQPPASAKAQTWWHWMNGNITKEGITADLEAMQRVGLGGATIVNVDCDIPRGPVIFMSPEWREDFKFAVQEADRLGLELCVENCAGWSSSGGPWNTPEHAMQHVVTSEQRVKGPVVFDATLPQPPVTLGFYRDIAVLAFAAPPAGNVKMRAATRAASKLKIKHAVYEAVDGAGSMNVTAKLVKLLRKRAIRIVASNGEFGRDPAFGHVKRLRVEYTLDGKPGTATVAENETLTLPPSAGADEAIPRAGIVDLRAWLAADGKLKWDVPPGNWIILRLGYTPTGQNNHPAPAEGTGLECDKFSPEALDAHWAGFMQKILDDLGPLAGKTLDSSLIDSYEVGDQNWTAKFREEFKTRRGYDPLLWLPAFTGRIVDSPEVTERFLWDVRRTIADLFAENYYGHFQELCHKSGLMAAFEPYTGPFESLQCGRAADLVMGEFWSGSQGDPSVKLAASVAHIYGKPIVGAESFTSAPEHGRWQNDPWSLKPLGDLMYCTGVNRYTFHRYAMQPWTNRWPGMTMGQWGFHFERTVTWWEQGKAWLDYVARCQFLLQQGRYVADAAYFDGESAPVELRANNPALPPGYDFDAINADVLLHRASVDNGRLTLPGGVSYAALVLPPDDADLTPQLLGRIRGFVRDGLTVVGARPQHSPSLQDFPQCDEEVKALADELWGKCDGTAVTENTVGKGCVVWGKPMAEVFAERGLKPDFEFKGEAAGVKLAYCHRVAGEADIYFVSNQRRQCDAADCTFRVSGKMPELWHPDTGVIEPAPIWSEQDGRTTVGMQLDPAGSVFVVFRHAAGGADHVIAASGSVTQPPAAAGPKLVIKRAIYEAQDGSGSTDVTAKLAERVSNGEWPIVASNGELGGDPAAGHLKRLRVKYTLDGKPGTATAAEDETLTLPVSALRWPAPAWQVVSAAGRPVVETSANGTFELRTANGKLLKASASDVPAPIDVSGEWDLKFPPNWGAPAEVRLDKLVSWTDDADSGVRYFSGTAIYEKEIEVPAGFMRGDRDVWLDLGTVKNFAEISLNGRPLATLWKPPFRVNLTGTARAGRNELLVKVTNLWPNRLIGDEQLPDDREWDRKHLKAWPQWVLDGKPSPTGRYTFTTWHHWTKNDSPLESGLLGPVTMYVVDRRAAY